MIDNASKMNITELCVFFNQCKGTLSPQLQQLTASVNERFGEEPAVPDLGFPVICEFCETVVNRVIHMTIGNRTEEAIKHALEKASSAHFHELFLAHQK